MTRPARRATRLAAPLLVAGSLLLAACGDEPEPPPESTTQEGQVPTETSPEVLDKPEQQQVDATTAQEALPTLDDMPDDGWAIDSSTFSDAPISYEPAECADVEFDSQAANAFTDEHRVVREQARFSKYIGDGNLITATYIESHDEPYPTSLLDAAGQHVTDCGTYTHTQNDYTTTRHVEAISVPPLGDRSFGLRLTSDGLNSYTDRLYVRSGHNLIIVMVLSREETYDGELMTSYAEDILEELKTS